MRTSEADLSVLWPFTADQISGYVAYLRREGAVSVAAAVEAAAPYWTASGIRTEQAKVETRPA